MAFITFEGQEGAGKSTQIKLLYDNLILRGYNVILTRDPGGTLISEKIRDILTDLNNNAIAKETEALLYIAARAQLVNEIIAPHLVSGGIVLCDRFVDSTIAYQGFGNKLDVDKLTSINIFVAKGLVPDITFYLRIEPSEGIKRKSAYKELDRIESKALHYHMAVKNGYDQLSERFKERFVTIDAKISIEDIHKTILEKTETLIGQKKIIYKEDVL